MRILPPSIQDLPNFLHHLWIICFLLPPSWGQNYDLYSQSDTWTTAILILTYKHPVSKNLTTEKEENGRFATGTIKEAKGILLRPSRNVYGCVSLPKSQIPKQPWIALVEYGNCTPEVKMTLAEEGNASALLMINAPEVDASSVDFKGKIPGIILKAEHGKRIEELVKNGTQVMIEITEGPQVIHRIEVKKSSVLFVSVSFIVLMIVSLAWLVFYYIQRFRYAQARGRTQKQLGRAAKKVIAKLPQRTIKDGDQEIVEVEACPVCLEFYRISDVLRVLPCKHSYHKTCVDQWLVENRTCPMCKLNILKALGYQMPVPPTEEAHYILEVGQIAFGSGLDDSNEAGNGQHVEPVRTLLSNGSTTGGRYVRMIAVEHDRHSDGNESVESRNGSSSSEGILPPVTTTVELHDQDSLRNLVDDASQNRVEESPQNLVEDSQDPGHATSV
ncbi:RING finger protein 150-like [Lytechinus variegatus]|uniref:RING finger protein 150-like n=1 Tax=Lytechinus variegatus TaxID=7654 RepID=UPI001BB16C0C|nr:RING finger protein 150-like [Lytechinus variegatus]